MQITIEPTPLPSAYANIRIRNKAGETRSTITIRWEDAEQKKAELEAAYRDAALPVQHSRGRSKLFKT